MFSEELKTVNQSLHKGNFLSSPLLCKLYLVLFDIIPRVSSRPSVVQGKNMIPFRKQRRKKTREYPK